MDLDLTRDRSLTNETVLIIIIYTVNNNLVVLQVAKMVLSEETGYNEAGPGGSIVLNSTAEFCRTLGDIPTYGQAGNRDEDAQEIMVSNQSCFITSENKFYKPTEFVSNHLRLCESQFTAHRIHF